MRHCALIGSAALLLIGCGGGPPPLPSADAGPCAALYGAVCAVTDDGPGCDAYLAAGLVGADAKPLRGEARRRACAVAGQDEATVRVLQRQAPGAELRRVMVGEWGIDIVPGLLETPAFVEAPPDEQMDRLQGARRTLPHVSTTFFDDGRVRTTFGERADYGQYAVEGAADGWHQVSVRHDGGGHEASRVRATAAGLTLRLERLTMFLVERPGGRPVPGVCGRVMQAVCGESFDPAACVAAVVPAIEAPPIARVMWCQSVVDDPEALARLTAEGARAAAAACPFTGAWALDVEAVVKVNPDFAELSPEALAAAVDQLEAAMGEVELVFRPDGSSTIQHGEKKARARWQVALRLGSMVIVDVIESAFQRQEFLLKLEDDRLVVLHDDQTLYFRRR